MHIFYMYVSVIGLRNTRCRPALTFSQCQCKTFATLIYMYVYKYINIYMYIIGWSVKEIDEGKRSLTHEAEKIFKQSSAFGDPDALSHHTADECQQMHDSPFIYMINEE